MILNRSEKSYQLLEETNYVKARSLKATTTNAVIYILRIFILVIITGLIATTTFYIISAPKIGIVSYPLIKSFIRANLYSTSNIQGSVSSEFLSSVSVNILNNPNRIVSCYYNTPDKSGPNQLLPSNIHPHLCTHINVAFARIVDKQIWLEDHQYRTLTDIVKLKNSNPSLKVLLSVGGASNERGFSEMVANHASRKVFIRSIKSILRNYTLDGIDLDWEFPAVHLDNKNLMIDKRERQHFSQLLREIKSEYIREKRNYILTVAAAAPQNIVDAAYDVDQLNLYTDFVNIMTYDFHSYTKFTPFTGLNSPLYPRRCEQMYMATLNINYTVQMYLQKGLDRSKIVVGIPTYGHSFTLVNSANARVGSPASGVGSLGGMGFVNYPDICTFLRNNSDAVVQQETDAKVPYLYRDTEWVSFESPASVAAKADFIRGQGLGGAMIYSLNADDFGGVCRDARHGQEKFPLLRSIKNSLHENSTEVLGEKKK